MTFLFHSSSLSNLGKCSSQGIFKSRQGQKKEHAKLRRLRSNVGYVGAWVMWIRGCVRCVDQILRGLPGSK